MEKSTILGSNIEKVFLLHPQKKPKEEAVGGENKQTNKNLLFERTPKRGDRIRTVRSRLPINVREL